jgi:hypothetical protein
MEWLVPVEKCHLAFICSHWHKPHMIAIAVGISAQPAEEVIAIKALLRPKGRCPAPLWWVPSVEFMVPVKHLAGLGSDPGFHFPI